MMVRQTIFGNDGNCLRAAVASITNVPMDLVVNVLDGSAPESHWYERLDAWATDHGWELDIWAPGDPPLGWSIVCGKTVRSDDQTHAVVGYDAMMIWDPHPSDAFINEIRWWMSWTRIADDPCDEWQI